MTPRTRDTSVSSTLAGVPIADPLLALLDGAAGVAVACGSGTMIHQLNDGFLAETGLSREVVEGGTLELSEVFRDWSDFAADFGAHADGLAEAHIERGDPDAHPVLVRWRHDDDDKESWAMVVTTRSALVDAHDLRRVSRYDDLTGLPNRTGFLAATRRLIDADSDDRFVIAFVDLDHFKSINDSFGHLAGDQVLRVIAHRLRTAPLLDACCRLGGDEFAGLIRESRNRDTTAAAEALLDDLEQPITVDGVELTPAASIGLAPVTADLDRALGDADTAMYMAKRSGRGRVVRRDHGREPSTGVAGHDLITDDVKLSTRYQPILGADRVVGFETSARWLHGNELIDAKDLLPIAAATGMSAAVLRGLLDDGLAFAEVLLDLRPELGDWTIHVDVTSEQLWNESCAHEVSEALGRHGIDPRRLCIEVPEPALLVEPRLVVAVIGRLRDLGCLVAVDEFGAGYGSLTLLGDVPVDVVKLEPRLVEHVEQRSNRATIRAIVKLAEGMGLDVIALGVSTERQRRALASLGVELIQGPLAGEPSAPADLIGL